MLRLRPYALTLTMLLSGACIANAQSLPSTIDPSRLMPQQPTLQQPETQLPPARTEGLSRPIQAESPTGSEQVFLTLNSITIAEGSVYDQNVINNLFANDLGQRIAVSRLFDMAAELTARYRADGYFLSHVIVPPQDITDGHITLKAIEGYVSEIGFAGDHEPPFSIHHLAMSLPDLKPLRGSDLEDILLRMSQNGGVSMQTTLMPTTTESTDGGVRLLLTMNPRPGRGLVSVNNHGSRYIGPGQAVFSYEQPGLVTPGSSTTVSTILTPQINELGYFGLRHQWQVGPKADSLLIDASVSSVEPGYTLHDAELRGYARRLGIEWRHDLRLSRHESTTVGLRFDLLNSETKILGTPIFEDRIRAIRGFAERSLTTASSHHRWRLRVSQGIDLLNASDSNSPELTRADGDPSFTKVDAEFFYERPLSHNWQLAFNAAGQYALANLLASEEFSYGGIERGRAYDPAEFTADHGIAAGFELRHNYHTTFNALNWQPYLFTSATRLWQRQQPTDVSVAGSAGFGARLLHGQNFTGGLSIAWPLFERRGAPTYGNGWSPRLLAGISYRF